MVNIFGHHSFTGLSDNEAVELLKKNGFNELPSSKNNQLVTIILSVLKEPMFLLLITCGLLYLFLGSINDALLESSRVIANAFLSFVSLLNDFSSFDRNSSFNSSFVKSTFGLMSLS